MKALASDTISNTILKFYREIEKSPHHRYKSWEHCYTYFRSKHPNPNVASLHLAFYLASWGMYRGSSFLLQNDISIHHGVVKELLKRRSLQGITTADLRPDRIDEIVALIGWIKDHYEKMDKINRVKNHAVRVSNTLATKILLGSLACVPAYDQFFVQGLKLGKLSSYRPNMSSISALVDFYRENIKQFQKAQTYIQGKGGILYPSMKLVDMYFWQSGMDRRLTALHEAGHAFLQELVFPNESYEVDIIGVEGMAAGKMTPPPEGWPPRTTREDKMHDLQKALAGIAAESIEMTIDWYNCSGASEDIKAACRSFALLSFVSGKGGNAERLRYCLLNYRKELESYYDSAKDSLSRNWNAVERIAERLLVKQKLTAAKLRTLLQNDPGKA